ncbi:4'-phosphopantetheinyl transferase superfamily protein [Streptomyces sp. NBC_00320]|uniref:4'-phosphopantetheinyl transferase family protein n=1 Tax=Streptomyces sp. NBC_00320 TaxID=2975711 RepID=UPI002250503A|nr:4'-phosphopantetheinyl transferase superfamily protein [Streptomyces sp. NBC_00320]MCX5149072.1 4'-phosphopantetheinyl transferase superfamily protein [Streptomyces sp. NBC_00320]
MDTTFPPITPGHVHRWGGAGLVVAHRPGRGRAAPVSPVLPPHLSPAERRVVHALPARRRAEWVAGRVLAKRLVGEAVGAPEDDVEILPHDDGSPYVVVGGSPMPAVSVSISHTARHVAAALAPGPVGVDLCGTQSAAAVRRVGAHAFSPAEPALIGTDRPDVPAGAWALKEAAVKADRSGIFGDAPRRVRITGLEPPVLSGRRRAMVWQAGDAVLALVLAHPAPSPSVPAALSSGPAD